MIRTIWRSEDPVGFDGEFFTLPGLIGRPGPFCGSEPALMNAGFSPAGRDFAQRNCELLVTTFVDHERGRADVLEITGRARSQYGRDVGVLAVAYIVCRPTRAQAHEYHHYYANEQADWDATDRLIPTTSPTSSRGSAIRDSPGWRSLSSTTSTSSPTFARRSSRAWKPVDCAAPGTCRHELAAHRRSAEDHLCRAQLP